MRRQSFRSLALCYLCCLLFKKPAQKILAQFEQEGAEEAERYAGRVSDHSLSAYLCCLLFTKRAQKIRAQFEQEVAEEAERCAGRVSDHSLCYLCRLLFKKPAQKLRVRRLDADNPRWLESTPTLVND